MIEVAFVVLIIINIVLYHKMFHVYYFNFGFGFLREVIGAGVAAAVEIFLFFWVVDKIGPVLVTAGGIALKILALIFGIAVVYFGAKEIYDIVRKIRKLKGKKTEGEQKRAKNSCTKSSNQENGEESGQVKKEVAENKEKMEVSQEEQINSVSIEETVICHERNSENTAEESEEREAAQTEPYILEKVITEKPKDRYEKIDAEEKETVALQEKEVQKENESRKEGGVIEEQKLGEQEKVPSEKDLREEKMFCTYCGRKILRSAKFCIYCGKEMKYTKND